MPPLQKHAGFLSTEVIIHWCLASSFHETQRFVTALTSPTFRMLSSQASSARVSSPDHPGNREGIVWPISGSVWSPLQQIEWKVSPCHQPQQTLAPHSYLLSFIVMAIQSRHWTKLGSGWLWEMGEEHECGASGIPSSFLGRLGFLQFFQSEKIPGNRPQPSILPHWKLQGQTFPEELAQAVWGQAMACLIVQWNQSLVSFETCWMGVAWEVTENWVWTECTAGEVNRPALIN